MKRSTIKCFKQQNFKMKTNTEKTAEEMGKSIKPTCERNALLDSSLIHVETSGHNVVLRGEVRNHAEKDGAERSAGCASGVTSADNNLAVNEMA